MAYRIEITARAERDLLLIFDAIRAEESSAAHRWFLLLQDAIRSLSEHANRCPAAPEDISLRHLLYGRKPHIYRVIYRVHETDRTVLVLHIRHGARDAFDPDAL